MAFLLARRIRPHAARTSERTTHAHTTHTYHHCARNARMVANAGQNRRNASPAASMRVGKTTKDEIAPQHAAAYEPPTPLPGTIGSPVANRRRRPTGGRGAAIRDAAATKAWIGPSHGSAAAEVKPIPTDGFDTKLVRAPRLCQRRRRARPSSALLAAGDGAATNRCCHSSPAGTSLLRRALYQRPRRGVQRPMGGRDVAGANFRWTASLW